MTDDRNTDRRSLENEETVAELLRMAGPRPGIEAARRDRVYASVLEAWQERDGRSASRRAYGPVLKAWQRRGAGPGRLRWQLPAALAAAVLAVAVVLNTVDTDTPRPLTIGTISKVVAAGPGAPAWRPGDPVTAGTALATGAGERLGIRLARGQSLRIDANTRLVIAGPDRIDLVAGRVYADTGDFVYRDTGLLVATAYGAVRDVGTQFAVAIGADRLDVAVREGRVDVSAGAQEHVAVAGERLLVAADGGAERRDVGTTAAFWDWAAELAPDFDIENRSLLDFLKWVARETGMELSFASDEARLAAMRTDLHGSIADFTPLEALDSVIATTGFTYRIDGARLLIER